MTIYTKAPSSNSSVTVSSITNSLGGPGGLGEENLEFGNLDDGYYIIDVPWTVNLNGTLYDKLYVSTNSFMSFGIPTIPSASPTSPPTDKILLGNLNPSLSATSQNVYTKAFYSAIFGTSGNRSIRMRYEGGFSEDPTNFSSSPLSKSLLGRQSLTRYSFSGTATSFDLTIPWNINLNVKSGIIQNAVRVYRTSYIDFGKSELGNGRYNFTSTLNQLYIGYLPVTTIGTAIWAGIEGTFPNRTYRIRYEGVDSTETGSPPTEWEVTFYENNQNIIDVHTGNVIENQLSGRSGFYFNGTNPENLVLDLSNTSGSYSDRGTRLAQGNYPDTSPLIWEAIVYENNINRIDIQLGSRTSSSSIDDYYYGVYSSNNLLGSFSTKLNAGYSITSTYSEPVWQRVQKLYVKSSITSKFVSTGTPVVWNFCRNVYIKDSDNVWKYVHSGPPAYFFARRNTYEGDTYGNKGGSGIASFVNESFIVPNGVTTITVELWGGGGSGGAVIYGTSGAGGGGGYVKATLSVTPGETLLVRVGGGAWQYAPNVVQHPNVTYVRDPNQTNLIINTNPPIEVVSTRTDDFDFQTTRGGIGGSGGGYSAIFRGTTPLLIAGGGGGGGGGTGYVAPSSTFTVYGGNGGAGGGSIGQSGSDGSGPSALSNPARGGSGGSQIAGGTGGASGIRASCVGTPGENGGSLVGGRGKNSIEGQSGSTILLVDNGSASNPGLGGGAAGGGGGELNTTVCNDGNIIYDPVTYRLYLANACGGGGGGGYYGGGGGGGGFPLFPQLTGSGGAGGGGGSNYVGGALSVIANSQGNGRTPGNTTSPYYLTSHLSPPQSEAVGLPFNAFAQGGVGYGGNGAAGGGSDTVSFGTRGENGLVVIYW